MFLSQRNLSWVSSLHMRQIHKRLRKKHRPVVIGSGFGHVAYFRNSLR